MSTVELSNSGFSLRFSIMHVDNPSPAPYAIKVSTLYVTRHVKRAVKSKFSKLIFIVDMIAVSLLFQQLIKLKKNIHNFLFYEIFNILKLVM